MEIVNLLRVIYQNLRKSENVQFTVSRKTACSGLSQALSSFDPNFVYNKKGSW